MVKPLEQREQDAYERAQKADINRRQYFLHANEATQIKIVIILGKMNDLIANKGEAAAHKYFFRQIVPYFKPSKPNDPIDWTEVHDQILWSCFSDDDMEGYQMNAGRVASQYIVYRALMELPREEDQDF